MKKAIRTILFTILFLLPIKVFANGNISVSPSSLSIEVGSTKTFNISAYNVIGDVTISSNNSGIATVSTSEWGTGMVEEGKTKTGTITVSGVSVGTTTITLTIDAATFDSEDLSGQKRTVTVNVVPKSNPAPSNNNNNNSNNKTTKNNNTSTNTNSNNITSNNNEPEKSDNNTLKEIKVDNHELKKVDNNNYTLTVSNDITSINISATAEDSKSKISGTGVHELNIGDNNIELTVTSESGKENKINIKVTRKDGFYIEDLETLLKNNKIKNISIIIDSDTKITSQDLSKIKNSKKTANFNYYNDSKKLIYSWSIDGSKINNTNEILTTIKYDSKYKKEIAKLSNYADGIYISFEKSEKLSDGIKIKLYVGDKFDNGDIVNVYNYIDDSKVLNLIKDKIKVKDGYIEFTVKNSSDYFITMSKIADSNKVDNISEKSSSKIIPIIILIILIMMFITSFIMMYIMFRKRIKNNKSNTSKENVISQPNDVENNSDINLIENNDIEMITDNNDNNSSIEDHNNFDIKIDDNELNNNHIDDYTSVDSNIFDLIEKYKYVDEEFDNKNNDINE